MEAGAAGRGTSAVVVAIVMGVTLLWVGHVARVQASDPEATQDFVVPAGMNASDVDGGFFTFRGFRDVVMQAGDDGYKAARRNNYKRYWASLFNGTANNYSSSSSSSGGGAFTFVKPVKAFVSEFPALSGLGVSAALLDFPAATQNPPHTHPRATELLFVLEGCLQVGFVDTSNKLYSQKKLQKGDLFVFPKGLVHFQSNPSSTSSARALSSFTSSNPGTISLASALFNSSVPASVLAQAFQVSGSTISLLQAPFQSVHIQG